MMGAFQQVQFMRAFSFCFLTLVFFSAWAQSTFQAQSRHSQSPEKFYQSPPSENKVLAALTSMNDCREANKDRQGYCELFINSGEKLTPAAALKRTAPNKRPLFLWRYKSTTATVFVAGSIHVLKEGFYPLPKQYVQAYNDSDVLVLEVNMEAIKPEALQATMLNYGSLKSGTLRTSMPADLYQSLQQVAPVYGIQLEQLQPFKPAVVGQQIQLMAMYSIGYEPEFGLESYFTSLDRDKTVLELESVEDQLDLLFNADRATQNALLRETLTQLPRLPDDTDAIIGKWIHGDDKGLESLIRESMGSSILARNFMKRLLDDRNERMASKILDYLSTNKNYFVIVGAAHLAGKNSVVSILNDQGQIGERFSSEDVVIN